MNLFALNNWFLANQRDLPWRKNPTPYQVWISEIMLQQTRVSVVQGYFQRWMERFPTVLSITEASLEEVIKLWEGLGYYSRARRIYQAASDVVQYHGGVLPSSYQELEKIPGLGPYTIGAILSFAFHQRAAAVDGNVMRVLARYTGLEEDITLPSTKRWIWQYAEGLLLGDTPWVIVEGLIELGAVICTRQPKCFICPLSRECLGLKKGIADLLPIKKKKERVIVLKREVAIVRFKEFWLLKKGQLGEVMADLYEFPYIEQGRGPDLESYLKESLHLTVEKSGTLPVVYHHFTRYKAILYPSVWNSLQKQPLSSYTWVHTEDLIKIPFSSGHRQILNNLETNAYFTY